MEKAVIYQIFTRLHGNKNTTCKENGDITENGTGKFEDFTTARLKSIKNLGATHLWFTGIIRHATTTDYSAYGIPTQNPSVVKGKAGSPYAICDYYDVDPDLAVNVDKRMEEFEALLSRCHKQGFKVIIDFVPNHVARQYKSICKPEGVRDLGEDDNTDWHFSTDNNFYYCVGEEFHTPGNTNADAVEYHEFPAKATGNDCFSSYPSVNDWFETVKLNYGVDYNDWSGTPSKHFSPTPSTWIKMTEILLFWASKGVDAFRCDMAEMVPCEFWNHAISKVKEQYPEMKFIGEVYNPALYRAYIGSGFDWLYDKVGMYDALKRVIRHEDSTQCLPSQWQSVDDIRNHMLYFLENHDEQRIASDFFAGDPWKAIPAVAVSLLLFTNPFMLYAGQEVGERGMDKEGFSGIDGRTTIFDYWGVKGLRKAFSQRTSRLKAEEQLEKTYARLIDISKNEKAFSEGLAYDIMYSNPQLHQQYAFMRQAKSDNTEVSSNFLVVTNFSEEAQDVQLNIPAHAFEFLKMQERKYLAHDLMQGTDTNVELQANKPFTVKVSANGVAVIQLL